MAKETLEALIGKYDDLGLTLTVGALYTGEAPQDAVCPFVVLTVLPDEEPFVTGDGVAREAAHYQFTIYSEERSPAQVMARADLLREALDPITDLDIDGYHTIRMDREGANLDPDPDQGWAYHVTYRVLYE